MPPQGVDHAVLARASGAVQRGAAVSADLRIAVDPCREQRLHNGVVPGARRGGGPLA